MNKLGLSDATIATMQEYDDYFEKWKNGEIDEATLAKSGVIEMAEEMGELNNDVLGEKLSNVMKVDGDIEFDSFINSSDGTQIARIVVNKGTQSEKMYTNVAQDGNKIESSDIVSLIKQSGEYDDLITDLEENEITLENAVDKLEGLYDDISLVATQELTIDEKGNIILEDYKDYEKENNQEKEDEHELE